MAGRMCVVCCPFCEEAATDPQPWDDLPTSSASSGLALSGCAARAVRKTISRLLLPLRTYVVSRSSSPDRHHRPWRALRKRRIHQYQCVGAVALSGRTAHRGHRAVNCTEKCPPAAAGGSRKYGPRDGDTLQRPEPMVAPALHCALPPLRPEAVSVRAHEATDCWRQCTSRAHAVTPSSWRST
jgi:hypothetical protein